MRRPPSSVAAAPRGARRARRRVAAPQRLGAQQVAQLGEVVALAFAGRVGDGGRATRGSGSRRRRRRPRVRRDATADRPSWSSVAVPVGLAEGLEPRPPRSRWRRVMAGDALGVDRRAGWSAAMNGGWRPSAVTQLARSRGAWAGAGARRGCASIGELVVAGAHLVGVGGHHQARRPARASLGRGGGEVDAVGEQRVELVAHLAVDPLASVCQQATVSRPAERLSAIVCGEAAVDDQRRLVDLQRDRDALLGARRGPAGATARRRASRRAAA